MVYLNVLAYCQSKEANMRTGVKVKSAFLFILFVAFVFGCGVALGADACVRPDNGSGTVTLPPMGCDYTSPDEYFMIIDGLPPGTTIEMEGILMDFICCQAPCPFWVAPRRRRSPPPSASRPVHRYGRPSGEADRSEYRSRESTPPGSAPSG